MTRFLLPALAALFLLSACKKDNGPCNGAEIVWYTPTLQGEDNWLWLSDEKGAVLEAKAAESRERYRLSTEDCAKTYNLTFLQKYRRPALVGNQLVQVEVYELLTYTDISDGLQFDTLITAAPIRAFAVEGIQTVEELLWPAESKEAFNRNIYIDPDAGLLSFEIPVPDGQPAFLTIRANGEAQTRFIWVDAADQDDYTFAYDGLQLLEPYGPASLPNNGSWRYTIRGLGMFGSTVLDYSSLPDLVQYEFGAALPPADVVRAFQVVARQESFHSGVAFNPVHYEKEGPGLPAAIPAPAFDFDFRRPATGQIQVEMIQGEAQALQVQYYDSAVNAGSGPWLRWTIVGSPDALISFNLPQWPDALAGIRDGLLDEGRNTPVFVTAKAYDSKAPYRQLLEARAGQDTGWEAAQGLLARSKAY